MAMRLNARRFLINVPGSGRLQLWQAGAVVPA